MKKTHLEKQDAWFARRLARFVENGNWASFRRDVIKRLIRFDRTRPRPGRPRKSVALTDR